MLVSASVFTSHLYNLTYYNRYVVHLRRRPHLVVRQLREAATTLMLRQRGAAVVAVLLRRRVLRVPLLLLQHVAAICCLPGVLLLMRHLLMGRHAAALPLPVPAVAAGKLLGCMWRIARASRLTCGNSRHPQRPGLSARPPRAVHAAAI